MKCKQSVSYASGLKTSFIVGSEGNNYTLQITDETKAAAFLLEHGSSVNTATHAWLANTPIGDDFLVARLYFTNTGLSLMEAYERSMAVVLKNSGLTLFKAPATTPPLPNNVFKKIGVNEARDSSGNSIFTKVDCP